MKGKSQEKILQEAHICTLFTSKHNMYDVYVATQISNQDVTVQIWKLTAKWKLPELMIMINVSRAQILSSFTTYTETILSFQFFKYSFSSLKVWLHTFSLGAHECCNYFKKQKSRSSRKQKWEKEVKYHDVPSSQYWFDSKMTSWK